MLMDYFTTAYKKLFEQSFVIIFCVLGMTVLGAIHWKQDEKKEIRMDKLEMEIDRIQRERYTCKDNFIECQAEVLRLTKVIEDLEVKIKKAR